MIMRLANEALERKQDKKRGKARANLDEQTHARESTQRWMKEQEHALQTSVKDVEAKRQSLVALEQNLKARLAKSEVDFNGLKNVLGTLKREINVLREENKLCTRPANQQAHRKDDSATSEKRRRAIDRQMRREQRRRLRELKKSMSKKEWKAYKSSLQSKKPEEGLSRTSAPTENMLDKWSKSIETNIVPNGTCTSCMGGPIGGRVNSQPHVRYAYRPSVRRRHEPGSFLRNF